MPRVFNSARDRPAWKRFEVRFPEEAEALTNAISPIVKEVGDELEKGKASFSIAERLPWDRLFEAYKLMSQLVGLDDRYVMRDGRADQNYLWH